MRTAVLAHIVRQTDPDLRAVVEQFATGEGRSAIQAFAKHGHMTEIGDTVERFRAIAKASLTMRRIRSLSLLTMLRGEN